MVANVNKDNRRVDLIEKAIVAENPDLILLMETTPGWVEELKSVLAGYPYRVSTLRENPFSILLVSRIPLNQAETVWLQDDMSPALFAVVCKGIEGVDGHCLKVLGVHPAPPIRARSASRRNRQLAEIAAFVKARGVRDFVLLGDFNATPWSRHFRTLIERTGLRDAARGRGLQATWMLDIPFVGIPIDHVLVGPRIRVIDYRVGHKIGSDHYPVIADFSF